MCNCSAYITVSCFICRFDIVPQISALSLSHIQINFISTTRIASCRSSPYLGLISICVCVCVCMRVWVMLNRFPYSLLTVQVSEWVWVGVCDVKSFGVSTVQVTELWQCLLKRDWVQLLILQKWQSSTLSVCVCVCVCVCHCTLPANAVMTHARHTHTHTHTHRYTYIYCEDKPHSN